MTNDDLLPSNSTALERSFSGALSRLTNIPVPIREIWNIDTCPNSMLAYLAWAFRVDRWEASWSDDVKRSVIKASRDAHRKKGTIYSIKRSIEPFGYEAIITEWWNIDNGVPGTFQIEINLNGSPINEDQFDEILSLINKTKPVSRKMTFLQVSVNEKASFYAGAGYTDGEIISIG